MVSTMTRRQSGFSVLTTTAPGQVIDVSPCVV